MVTKAMDSLADDMVAVPRMGEGLAPFGYRLDSKTSTLVVEPEEAAVVKIIYEKFVHEGMGADSICSYLNQRGYAKQKNREFELNYFAPGAYHAGAGQSGIYRKDHLWEKHYGTGERDQG